MWKKKKKSEQTDVKLDAKGCCLATEEYFFLGAGLD